MKTHFAWMLVAGTLLGCLLAETAFGQFLHKGAVSIEMSYFAGSNLAGSGVNQIMDAENNYLSSLGLVEIESNTDGQVLSTTPIEEYTSPSEYMTGGMRLLYYASPKTGLGAHYFFSEYSQELTILEHRGIGSVMNLINLGPSVTYFPYQKNKFGISLKADLGFVSGTFTSVPALYYLSSIGAFDDVAGLASSIMNRQKKADLSGMQANVGASANWFICRWFSLDAGVSLYYYQGEITQAIWSDTPSTFLAFTPAMHLGINFHLFNKN